MAIDRTRFHQWRDDDGSGDVGTKMNRKTIATDLLDPIDVAIQEATVAGRHAHTHEPGGMDPITITIAQVAELTEVLKAKADVTDPRFNYRPPPGTLGPHNTTHGATGSDPLAISSLAGYPQDGTVFLNGQGAWVHLNVEAIRHTLGVLISWMAQSANSPISQDEAKQLLKMLDGK